MSAPEPPPQSRRRSGRIVLPSKEDWDRASAYYRNYVASAPSPSVVAAEEKAVSAGRAPPLLFDKQRHEQAVIRALAELKTGWGHEQAAVAAAASGSTETGAAKEPNLWGRMWAPDGEEVPLPPNLKRKRTDESDEAVWDPLALHRWHDKRQKVESSAVAGKESPAVADNGRTLGLQISGCMFLMEVQEREAEEWVRGRCCMVPMESRQKEDEEVSSQATTLQFGSPGKSRREEYVCLGHPHCEKFDCDLCEHPSEKGVEDVKEDERNGIDRASARARERKEAHIPELGKGKGKDRSGGRAAPKKDRKAKDKEKGKEAEPCTCENCMSQETYELYIKEKLEKAKEKEKAMDKTKAKARGKANKDKEKARSELFVELQEEGRQLRLEREAKAKEKEKAKDKERGKGKEKGNGKGKGKGKGEVERETVEERRAKIAELQDQWSRGMIHNLAEYEERAKLALGVLKATPPSKEAHEFKSCDTGTLRYRADIPLNERSGAPVVIGPPRTDPVPCPWDEIIRSGGWSDTDTDLMSTDSD